MGNLFNKQNELGFTGTPLLESALEVIQDVILIKLSRQSKCYGMLHYSAKSTVSEIGR